LEGVLGMSDDAIRQARRWFAEELRFIARAGMLLAKRRERDEFEARFLCPVWFYEFAGARDAEVSNRPAKAFAEDRGVGVKSVRTDWHAEDTTCWLHGEGWRLSRRELDQAQ
jgi:protein-L-isoaspartate(D-aspartate) O-methyltransferase